MTQGDYDKNKRKAYRKWLSVRVRKESLFAARHGSYTGKRQKKGLRAYLK
jgi:hypothetical protein